MALNNKRGHMAYLQPSLVLLLTLSLSTIAVDRGNFKTCDQSGFCKRQRATEPNKSPYVAVLSSINIQPTQLSVQLLNKNTNVRLNLQVIAIKGNIARLRVTETNPLKPRYEIPVGDVLVDEPVQQGLEVLSKDSKSVTVGFLDNKIAIQSDPFRIDFIVRGEPVLSVNSRGLMNFEHIREKAQPPEKAGEEEEKKEEPKEGDGEEQEEVLDDDDDDDDDDDNNDDKNNDAEGEEPGMWEETFKTHKDTKPLGPESIGLDFSFPGFEHVYGIPEHADTLALKSTTSTDPYRLYNLDVFEYELDNPMALYGAVPYMIAHNEKRTVGLFWLNAAEMWVDITSVTADKNVLSKMVDFVAGGDEMPQIDTHWFAESGIIDVFVLLGPSANEVFKQYASLTGTTALPPLFSLAYHQSRWNYNDQDDVRNVDAGFDANNIPYDVIWLDIEHTDGKRYFTWDTGRFPESAEMIKNISSKGRKMVTIIDPHIKRDSNYKIHQEAEAKGYYVKNKDGNDYDGWCWPGSSSWLDYTNPEIRDYWVEKMSLEEYQGSTLDLYTWNDMNEPSVFNGPEITMHKDALHFNNWEHRDVHNIYGMYQQMATALGQVKRSQGKLRPFVLSRAFFAGTQRWGAVWTGDNTGEWGHLKASNPMLLSLNLAGITFSGADVGGFFKNPDTELLTRWYQAAAYQPFFRAHAHIDTPRREPWLKPAEHLDAIREAIKARYVLLPYWYTLFYLSETSGAPVMRPMWVEFPGDKSVFSIEDQYMVGSGLLVRPVTEQGAVGVTVYFPGTDQVYYDADTYKAFPGGQNTYIPVTLNKIPVFYRGGNIIARKERVRRSSILGRLDPYTLVIALNKQGRASGDLYIDDYQSFSYKNGEFIHRKFTFENNKLTNSNADSSGSFETASWLERVRIVGLNRRPSKIQITSSSGTTELEFKYDNNNDMLTIRKPSINIAQDFTITLQ
ncbi:unnamed protein product [Owenia fusiformis]|uniref:Neutral alpha-glucosidase AB n=1 Tax=Owenia fusiformis TaxID=6347 RepID=A0A8J1U731_OWEFU|nr:unnamed protein product [Owenia fusiformis]